MRFADLPYQRALCNCHGNHASASTLIIPHKFSVNSFGKLYQILDVPGFLQYATQFSYILNNEEIPDDISSLRFARSASAPLSPDIHRKFEERFKVPN